MIDVSSVQASAFTEANIVDVGSYEELKAAVAERKWARGPWAGLTLASHCFQTFKCIVWQVNMSAALGKSICQQHLLRVNDNIYMCDFQGCLMTRGQDV